MTHLSLFSGIGGLDLAAEWAGFETVGQCEFADYPTKVLEKHWPTVPRWRDIRTLTAEDFYAKTGLRTVDVISGGFPCQPFSVAGKQKGKGDDRYLWPEMCRVIRELKPRWVVGENVPGILRLAAADVVQDLEREGFNAVVLDFEAAAVGAYHRRERVAFVAHHPDRGRRDEGEKQIVAGRKGAESAGVCADVAHADQQGLQGRDGAELSECARQWVAGEGGAYVADAESPKQQGKRGAPRGRRPEPGCGGGWPAEPDVGRVAYEFSARLDGGGLNEQTSGEKSSSKVCCYGEMRDVRCGMGVREGILSEPLKEREQDMQPGVWGCLRKNLCDAKMAWWKTEPDIPRVANGIKNRVDRLRCLGNAVVPQQFYPIFKAIAEVENAL